MGSDELPDAEVEPGDRHYHSVAEICSPAPASQKPHGDSSRQSDLLAVSQFLPALVIFLALAVSLGLTTADRLVSALDEGIYLDGAERIIAGQIPYRDFFVLTGPGSFWIQAGMLKLLGLSFIHARLVLVMEVAFLAAAVFWCTAHLRGRKLAALTTFLFVAFETANPGVFTVNHRWDSSALGVAAVLLLFSSLERAGRARVVAAGALAALVVWITPTLLALAIALPFALILARRTDLLHPYAAGLVAGFIAPALVLWRQGGLLAMMQHMFWTVSNYPSANGVSYGHLIGGYPAAIRGSSLLETAIRVLVVLVIAIPVLLPLLTMLVWPIRLRRSSRSGMLYRRQILFLLVASIGLWLSAYPWFVGQLTSTAPLCYILGGVLLAEIPPTGEALPLLLRRALLVCAISLGLVFLLNTLRSPDGVVMRTRAGRIRVNQGDAQLIGMLSEHVSSRDTLFVFPYTPILYFITGAANPTRYSFLQPGMMTDVDERSALADLERKPPRWVLYQDVPPEAYLRIWPTSDPKRLRMKLLEEFMHSRYHAVRQYRLRFGYYELRELNQR